MGDYMANQMDDLIEGGIRMMDDLFDELYTGLEAKGLSKESISEVGKRVWEAIHTEEVTDPSSYIRGVIEEYKDD